jgi:hypothetical protein
MKISVNPIPIGVLPHEGGKTGRTNAQRNTAITSSISHVSIDFMLNFFILVILSN